MPPFRADRRRVARGDGFNRRPKAIYIFLTGEAVAPGVGALLNLHSFEAFICPQSVRGASARLYCDSLEIGGKAQQAQVLNGTNEGCLSTSRRAYNSAGASASGEGVGGGNLLLGLAVRKVVGFGTFSYVTLPVRL